MKAVKRINYLETEEHLSDCPHKWSETYLQFWMVLSESWQFWTVACVILCTMLQIPWNVYELQNHRQVCAEFVGWGPVSNSEITDDWGASDGWEYSTVGGNNKCVYTRDVCKVRGLTLLLRVGTLWRCGDGLFFEVPPSTSDALLTTLHPLLENGVTVVLKEPLLGWRSTLSGASALRDWKVVMDALTKIGGTPLEHPPYSPDLALCDFWAFPNMKRSKPPVPLSSRSLRQTVCSTFSRSGWSVVRSASLSKGGTSKKRPLPHLHKVPSRSNKASPRTFQTARLVIVGKHYDRRSVCEL
jgi:hypothetical protein